MLIDSANDIQHLNKIYPAHSLSEGLFSFMYLTISHAVCVIFENTIGRVR
jgi:hypothetical protein